MWVSYQQWILFVLLFLLQMGVIHGQCPQQCLCMSQIQVSTKAFSCVCVFCATARSAVKFVSRSSGGSNLIDTTAATKPQLPQKTKPLTVGHLATHPIYPGYQVLEAWADANLRGKNRSLTPTPSSASMTAAALEIMPYHPSGWWVKFARKR